MKTLKTRFFHRLFLAIIILVVSILLVGCIAQKDTPVSSSGTAPAEILQSQPPTPSATLTTEQQLVLNELKRYHSCDQSCMATRQANDSYAEYGTPQKIIRTEWEILFPSTRFYIAPWIDHYKGVTQPRKTLFIFQDEKWYEAKTYDLLLQDTQTVITDENRELVAKAWALMTIPEYLGEEITFTKWEREKDPRYSSAGVYNLTGWTKLGGLELTWSFAFSHKEYKLVTLGPNVLQIGIGDYIEIPIADGAPLPPQNAFYFFPVK